MGYFCSLIIFKLHLASPWGCAVLCWGVCYDVLWLCYAISAPVPAWREKRVCSSYGSSSLLPASPLSPCLPWVQRTVRYNETDTEGLLHIKVALPHWASSRNPFAYWRKITYLLTQHKLSKVIRLWPDCYQVDDITFSPNEMAAIANMWHPEWKI